VSSIETRPAAPELVRFVRDTLGCGCPDEVVSRTVVEVATDGVRGLDVGGRLLVRVLPAADRDRLITDFPESVERWLSERDRRGFRRLRLVAVDDEPAAVAEVLEAMLAAIVADDDRVAVHVVSSEVLPAVLTADG
jgi:hypothetical protein